VKRTVLLVEDEGDTREMLATAIERAGYRCITAGSAEAAIARAVDADLIDVVVTDVVMDGNDRRGLTLMDELRAIGVRAPIIIITAYADVQKVKIALNHGAAHLLEKPFRAPELVEAIALVQEHDGDVEHLVRRVLARAHLTDKETVVARHLLEGRTSDEIADLERNSPKTIRQHVTQIYLKCGARNRAEFVRGVYVAANKRGEAGG
jgi:DNA-binding NarL/FixJ family response regulator